MKKLVVLAVLLAASVLGFLAWRARHHQGASAAPLDRTDVTTTNTTSTPVPLDAPGSGTARVDVTTPSVSVPARADVANTTENAPALGYVRLHGSVVVVDPDGAEHPSESGVMRLSVVTENVANIIDATVVNGRYEVDVVPGDALDFVAARLGGRIAFALGEGPTTRPFPDDHVHDLRLQWPRATMLHARDAHSGVELTSIEVVAYAEDFRFRSIVPRRLQGPNTVALRGDSPLALNIGDFDALSSESLPLDTNVVGLVHVRAPNHGWAEIAIDPRQGGDVFVELELGAGLDVDVIGHDPADPVIVRLQRAGEDAPSVEREWSEADPLRFDGLPVGTYTVAAEVGRWYENPLRLAAEEVQLVPSGRSHVTLALASMPKVERATLSGVLVVPNEWNARGLVLQGSYVGVAGKEEDRRVSTLLSRPQSYPGYDTYSWSFPSILVGKYTFALSQPPYSIAIELPVGGRGDVRIEIPPPVDVSVRLVDDQTRTDVEGPDVYWNWAWSEDVTGGILENTTRDAAIARYTFRAPTGPVEISVFDPRSDYESEYKSVTLVPGRNDVQIPLRRACGVVLVLMDGDRAWQTMEWPDFDLRAVEGDGQIRGRSTSASECRYVVTKPGRYRVNLQHRIPGYFPIAETIFDIPASTMTRHVIQLKRKP